MVWRGHREWYGRGHREKERAVVRVKLGLDSPNGKVSLGKVMFAREHITFHLEIFRRASYILTSFST